MKWKVIPAAQLGQEHRIAWSEIQRANPELDSPYFRPEFTQAVASVRDDVEVAVLEDHGEMVGFFPFQRSRGGLCRPIGGRLSDFQGVVIRPGLVWNPAELLRGCGLKVWHFDHALASQEPLRPYHWRLEDSPYLDISGGFEAYLARHGRRAKNPFPHLERKLSKLQKEVGPLRFEVDIQDDHVFDTLIRWKTQQYLRTGATNVFAFAWTRLLLERISRCRGEAFAGVLSALYAGSRLVAAHFGMRSYKVLHLWFPSYDLDVARASPGAIRDVELMKCAQSMGIERFDFGKGMTDSKEYFMSGMVQVATGCVDRRWATGTLRRQWHRAHDWARATPLRRPARVPARVLYRIREWFAFR
jgi:CelD/BcsL family acetyltransferase involved in cellulose biosynthesis